MLLYFQKALKGFYKQTFIKHICNVKAGYVMCQKSIYIINLFCFKKKKKLREKSSWLQLNYGMASYFSFLSFTVHGAILFFPSLKIIQI